MHSSMTLLQAFILFASIVASKAASVAQGQSLVIRQATPDCSTCSVFTNAATTCTGDKTCMCASTVQQGLQTCLNCLNDQQVAALDASSFNKLCAGLATVTAAGPVPTALTSVSLGAPDGSSASTSVDDDGSSGSSTDDSASATLSSASSEASVAATSTPTANGSGGATNTASGGQAANTGAASGGSSSNPSTGANNSGGVSTMKTGGVSILGAAALLVPLLL